MNAIPPGAQDDRTAAEAAAPACESSGPPQWARIDTVLLDMDGTLLDLCFDNYFWLELVPERYAARHGLTLEQARSVLAPRFAAVHGTLDWYCIDFWSRELGLDIAGLKREAAARVCFLPGAERFLRGVKEHGRTTMLVTNAHRESLAVKAARTGLTRYFDVVVSSHDFGVPKEHAAFWRALQDRQSFDPARSLFVDDSPTVLQAARRHGIGQIYAISRPDSTRQPHQVAGFACVEAVEDLLEGLEGFERLGR